MAEALALQTLPPYNSYLATMIIRILPITLALFSSALAISAEPTGKLLGYKESTAAQEQALEQRFDEQLNPADLQTWLKQLSSAPNQVGSPHDKANAEFILSKFKEWGWDARIEMFDVLYPTPRKETLELLTPHKYVARLREPPITGDSTSAQTQGVLPAYAIYGADGNVTAELVYVNYGMPDDYDTLKRLEVSVEGKIVIARYGGGWRGLKPRLADEHGAIGCIIYSDPSEDGYREGDVYPRGGYRPEYGIQRGSVSNVALYSGDPLTPGIGSIKDAPRLSRENAKTLMRIPVIPISYGDAKQFLSALDGPIAPDHWRGNLPITYHVGPGKARVHLQVVSDWNRETIYDVIATLRGSDQPDQWLLRGNHHDAWVFGAWDPLSGQVALMAEAKAFDALLKQGWKPKRTLVYTSWDAEEPGLLGSTEWAETHSDELQKKAVLYVNSDTNGRGFLEAGGSHSLQHLVNEVASGIPDPETKTSTLDRLRAKLLVSATEKDAKDEEKKLPKIVASGADVPIKALGSGSDFTPFFQHLGIATLSLEYGGEDDDEGIYHSAYDSYDHYIRFGDPTFSYGVTLAKTIGHTLLRMEESDVFPFQFASFAETIGRYVENLNTLRNKMREEDANQAKLLDSNAYALAEDPTKHLSPPEKKSEVPAIDFSPLDQSLKRLKESAAGYDAALQSAQANGFQGIAPDRIASLNQLLQGAEQRLLSEEGLPGRAWYRHLVYAPGMNTGYEAKTLPGILEAIEGRRWDEAKEYVKRTASVLNNYCDQIDRAAALLQKQGADKTAQTGSQ